MRLTALLCLLMLAVSLDVEAANSDRILRHGFDAEDSPDETPRVRIKVFRSPLKEKDGEQYATWGFWVKQPAGAS